jgi:hypothetical protein
MKLSRGELGEHGEGKGICLIEEKFNTSFRPNAPVTPWFFRSTQNWG